MNTRDQLKHTHSFRELFEHSTGKQLEKHRLKFLTHPCTRQPLKIFFISNDRARSLFGAFDWLLICVDPSDVRDLRMNE